MAGDSVGSVSVSVVPSAEGFNSKLKAQVLEGADETGAELGEAIRAAAQERLDGLKAHVGADDEEAKAALDDLRAKAEGTDARIGVGVDPAEFLKVQAELDDLRVKVDELNGKKASIDVEVNNSSGVRGWLTSLIAGAVAIAPAFVVAAAGIGAFAALAVPSLKAVAKYEQDLGTNAGQAAADLAGMTSQQREMVAGIAGLKNEFTGLSSAVRPEVLQVFNEALAAADRILPELVPLAEAGGRALAGLVNQLGDALGDSNAQQFFDFLSKSVGPDVQAIGATLASLIRTFFSLTEALQPVSLGILSVIQGASGLLNVISQIAPPLDDVIVLSIALYKPLKAIGDLNLISTFGNLAKAIEGVGAASDAEGLKFGWLTSISSRIREIIATQKELAAAVAAAGASSEAAGAEYVTANSAALESQVALAASGTALTGVEEAIAAGELSAAEAGQALAVSLSELSVLTEAVDIALAEEAVAAEAVAIAMEELAAAEAEAAAASGLLDAVNPLAWVGLAIAGAVALGVALYKLSSDTDAATQRIISQNDAVGFNTAGYKNAASALDAYAGKQVTVSTAANRAAAGSRAAALGVTQYSAAADHAATAAVQQSQDYQNQSKFFGELASKYGLTRSQAIAFANAVGVTSDQVNKGGKSLADAESKLGAYAQAEEEAAKGTGAVSSNMAVLAFAANQQTSAVSKLAGAWSTYVTALTGTQSSFDSYAQGLSTLSTDAKSAGASFGGLSKSSLSLNSEFQSQLGSLQSVATALRTSAAGTQVYNQGVRGGIASMIQFAGTNKIAQQELLAVARQSDNGITSFKGLTEWAGNTSTGLKRMQDASDKATLADAKLSDASKALGSALQNDVSDSMAAAVFATSGAQAAINKYAQALANAHTPAQTLKSDHQALIAVLEKAGLSASQASQEADALAKAEANAGNSAETAGGQIHTLAGYIDGLHDKTINIDVVLNQSGEDPGAGVNRTGAGSPFAAGGAVIPGYSPGRDTVPLLASPGEGVAVPELVRAIGPKNFMALNHQYSGGRKSSPGLMAGGGIAASHQFAFPQDIFNIVVGPIGIGPFGGGGGQVTSGPIGTGGFGGGASAGGGGGGGVVSGMPIFSQGSLDSLLRDEIRKGVSASSINDAGKALAKAFSDAYKDTASQIRDDTKTALSDIRQFYSGPAATQLENTIRTQGDALAKLATASQNLASKIADMKAYAAQETQSLEPFADLSSMDGATDANGKVIPVTGTLIATNLQKDLATLKKFERIIVQLKAAGVDKVLIAQVIALGPADGVTYGEAILAGGKNLISQLNTEEKQIGAIDVKIGKKAADVQFGQPLAKGFLDGLDKEKSELEKRMKHLGDVLAKELEKALHDKTGTTTKAASSAAVAYSAPAAATSINGSIGASGFTRTDATEIRASLRTIAARELNLMTKAQATRVIALLEAAPKATGVATGNAVAGELKSIAKSAAATARAATR